MYDSLSPVESGRLLGVTFVDWERLQPLHHSAIRKKVFIVMVWCL